MDTNDKHIVSIDLGSSKIALTVAKVNGEDIQIIYYKETPSAGIRYSSVFNVMHVTAPLRAAISQAEEELGIRITQAVVGMPKFPVRQESSNAEIHDRGFDTDITAEDIDNLKDFAKSLYPLEDETKEAIYGAVAQSFSDGENFQIIESDIIGMWMLARKYLEQWWVWFVVDVVCVGLYIYKELYFTAGLYGLYAIIAVFGWWNWKKLMKTQQV